jgi:membrane protease YdiL (CAAX protease family)
MLRAPWRIGAFLLVALAATLVANVIAYPIRRIPAAWIGDPLLITGWISVLVLLVAHAVCLRRVDKLPWSAAGLHRDAARPGLLAWSTMLGGAAIAVPALLIAAVGWLRFQPDRAGSSLGAALWALLLLAPFAFAEELMLRGYVLTVLRKALGWRAAVGLTSVVFGLLHIANPGSNPGNIAMVILAGVLLGVLVVLTGSLYAATAAHLAWNWVMAGVLHVPVSGLGVPTPDYRLVDAGPDWITGGAWGPEGGIGAALGMSAGLAYLYIRRSDQRQEQRDR